MRPTGAYSVHTKWRDPSGKSASDGRRAGWESRVTWVVRQVRPPSALSARETWSVPCTGRMKVRKSRPAGSTKSLRWLFSAVASGDTPVATVTTAGGAARRGGLCSSRETNSRSSVGRGTRPVAGRGMRYDRRVARLGRTAQARVQDVPEGVPQQVPAQDEEEDDNPREDDRIPVEERVPRHAQNPAAGHVDQLPPVGVANLGAQPEEGQRRGHKDDHAHVECRHDHEGVDRVRNDVAEDNAQIARAHGPCRLDVVPLLHRQNVPAEEPGIEGPAHERDGDHDMIEPLPQHRRDHYGQNETGKG